MKHRSLGFTGPEKFAQALADLEERASGTKEKPAYDYSDLVERFSQGAELSRLDRRKLAYALTEGMPPLLERPVLPQALEEMSQRLRSGSSQPLAGAIFCLLQVRPGASTGLDLLRQWVNENLKTYGPGHPLLEHWIQHADLFGPKGPDILAELMLRASSISEGLQASRVPPHCWLAEEALPNLGRWTAVEWHHKRQDFYGFLEAELPHSIARTLDAALRRLLEPGSSPSRVPEIEAFFLKHLGHPSLDHKGLWQTVSEPSRALARKWVNEKNIKLFYNHLVQAGDKHRLHFWMQYLDLVDDVRIAVGANDSYSSNPEISQALGKEIAYLDYAESSVSAVFLKVGGWWIVEFSQVGNATFGYRAEHKPADFWWKSVRYSIYSLKAGVDWPHRVIHPARKLPDSDWRQGYAYRLRDALNNEFPLAGFVPGP